MSTIAEKLQAVLDAKASIKTAIQKQGISVGEIPLARYADKIREIAGGGEGGAVDQALSASNYDPSILLEMIRSSSSITAGWSDYSQAQDKAMFFIPHIPGKAILSFNGCGNLMFCPPLDFTQTTLATSLFNSCFSLTILKVCGTQQLINTVFMFSRSGIRYLSGMESLPALQTAAGMFSEAKNLVIFPDVDLSHAYTVSNLVNSCTNLERIPKLNVSSCTEAINIGKNQYEKLSNLRIIRIEGSIHAPFQLFADGVDYDSLLSILHGLGDHTGSAPLICSLGSSNLNKLSEKDKAIAAAKNWTLN